MVFGTTPGGEHALSKDAVPDVYPLYYCLVPIQRFNATLLMTGLPVVLQNIDRFT